MFKASSAVQAIGLKGFRVCRGLWLRVLNLRLSAAQCLGFGVSGYRVSLCLKHGASIKVIVLQTFLVLLCSCGVQESGEGCMCLDT